ncbi:hypothetical protein MARPU_03950 [Marichromatium purpuratum 984]|uniref:Uncharacterized protein n=1 Tax=Marichromatium purpuratum 984 TaxID=765910 RepID=W0E1M7_MARPU|nr:hypothetical protein [Marichromatium purpuratum]AHF03124.1 hypothetical protein MARPU_03950 [Marichromatium purpuratum 984]
MISGINQGLQGIRVGTEGVRRNAAEIASAETLNGQGSTRELTEPLVEQTQNLRQVEASSKVVAAGDEMIGSLIDVMA